MWLTTYIKVVSDIMAIAEVGLPDALYGQRPGIIMKQ